MGARSTTGVACWVELSAENAPLAEAELDATVEVLGGRRSTETDPQLGPRYRYVRLPRFELASALMQRLAHARRCLRELPEASAEEFQSVFRSEGHAGARASFRPLGHPSSAALPPEIRWIADAYCEAGGRIDLTSPSRRFWFHRGRATGWRLFEELAATDRATYELRRMPRYPFQRPVSLRPRLARALANLARIRAGDRLVDPFVGTGSLAIECALLGARVTGIDRDAAMIRGALRNFAYVGLSAERLEVGDAAETARRAAPDEWAALVTDPPYGRASGAGGEPADRVRRRGMSAWSERIRIGGRIVLATPAGEEDPVGPEWERELTVTDRVHRSLTREFRVYRRRPRS